MRHGARTVALFLFFGVLATALPASALAGPGAGTTSADSARQARATSRKLAEDLIGLAEKLIQEGRIDQAKQTLTVLQQVLDLQHELDRLAAGIGQSSAAAASPAGKGIAPEPPEPPTDVLHQLEKEQREGLTGIGGGAGGAFGGRGGHRNLKTEGGTVRTEQAVDLGLGWLKRHQDPGGFWDCDGFQKECKLNICSGAGSALYDPGVTGLSLLAFLGAGHTHLAGPYKTTVQNGLVYLKQIQDPEGCFGPRTAMHFTYNHAIDTLAMCEAYGLTGSPLLKRSAEAGIDFVLKCQNPYLAWRYGVRPGDNDTSVSGWMVAALKSGKEAGLRVGTAGYEGMKAWLDKVTEPEYGRVGYLTRGSGSARPQDLIEKFPSDKSEAMTAVGILCRIWIGEYPKSSEMIEKGTDLCLKCLPVWDDQGGTIDMVYWYFGSLALFQVGGRPWREWNRALQSAVVDHQRKDGDEKGSWDPKGVWGRDGGRIYSTALCTMMMETYYRYARIFR